MANDRSRRRFRYFASPEEVRQYVASLDYKTQDMYLPNIQEPIGFEVIDTTVKLTYGGTIDGYNMGFGTIGLHNHGLLDGDDVDVEIAERSLKLYQKLYRRYHKPK
jgi:hypothetical protein